MDGRQLKHFDLPEPKTQAHFGLGQHYELKPPYPAVETSGNDMLYRMVREQMVAFAKSTDKMILDAIIKKAKEHGITDLYVLNEDFIVAAIQEKMEREADSK